MVVVASLTVRASINLLSWVWPRATDAAESRVKPRRKGDRRMGRKIVLERMFMDTS